MHKITALKRIHEHRVSNCTLCELHKSSTHVCIFGKGEPKHGLMFVGEAPGEAEAITAMPFMGPSGKLLSSLLKDLNLYDHAYITNAVKCRPPLNMRPNKGQIAACHGYLEKEIQEVKPRVIVCVGKIALLAVTGKEDATRGKPFEYRWKSKEGHAVRSTAFHVYHPSYCLRVMSAIKDLTEQLEAVADFYLNPRS